MFDVQEQVKDFKERMDRTREQASQNATAVVAALKVSFSLDQSFAFIYLIVHAV